jgi:hypothetical protein
MDRMPGAADLATSRVSCNDRSARRSGAQVGPKRETEIACSKQADPKLGTLQATLGDPMIQVDSSM